MSWVSMIRDSRAHIGCDEYKSSVVRTLPGSGIPTPGSRPAARTGGANTAGTSSVPAVHRLPPPLLH